MRFTTTLGIFVAAGLIWAAIAAGQVVEKKPGTVQDSHRPHAGMLRYPDISDKHIVFSYANDLWIVSREGGTAYPLASPPGQESFPRFAPDGRSIAYIGNYEGNRDIYITTIDGSASTRVTYHPAEEVLCDWTQDNRLLYFANGLAGLPRQTQLFTTRPEGGLATRLPVPYGANGSINAEGKWLAYTPHSRDGRTWKRYRGGMATDIWLFDLENHKSKKITDWEGTDSQPMWHGNKVYYMSDGGPEHRLNIWSYDPTTEKREQITKLTDYDAKWPSIGPGPGGKGEIVFQNGRNLSVVALDTGAVRNVDVIVPGDRPTIRQRDYEAGKFIQSYDISATGQRAVVQARGDVWTIPAKKGTPRNLTRTSGVAERDPAWSPDGQWIAYFSDEPGEYELYITQSDGRGETRKVTSDGGRYRFNPVWSPDSKRILFTDNTGGLFLHTLEGGETKLIDRDPYGRMGRASWSSDSDWVTYAKTMDNQVTNAVWIYQVSKGEKTKVTAGMFNDTWPTFDRKGDYLFLASCRNFDNPIYEDLGTTFVYASTDMLFAIPLRDEVGSPWAPKSDEEKWGEEKRKEEEKEKEKGKDKEKESKKDEAEKKDENDDKDKEKPQAAAQDSQKKEESVGDDEEEKGDKKDDKAKEAPKPVQIELAGFEQRMIAIPVPKGNFSDLAVNHEGKLIYSRTGARGDQSKPAIKIFDLKDEEKKEKTVLEDASSFAMSADGKKLLIRKGETLAIVDAAADQKLDKPMSLGDMFGRVDPRAEWKQMFHEAWRIQREYFYDPNMHAVDWNRLREHYGRMVDDCASREDLDFVIGELISELNVGHAYVRGGGDYEKPKEVSVGMLGCDFQLDQGTYKIAKIYEGAEWDHDGRGPLSQPGVKVKEGDYLLAVNGVPVDPSRDPWAAFQGLGGKVVHLTVSDKPTLDDTARHEVVELLRNEMEVRYRSWIEAKRKYVEEQSGGKVGYIYVPNTGVNGQNDLFRQFFGQKDRAALIIDERWNGGGQIPTRFIELLNRPVTNYWTSRAERDGIWPPDAHAGPKCMLINGLAGSGGDCFPYYFRQSKLGKLIGMRTWGGLVGISGNPSLIDGGRTSAPTFAFWELDGTWGVEGHGVDPDIEVIDDPALMVTGGDPQLDTAIRLMLQEIEKNGFKQPGRPKFPDRSRMGIAEEDK